MEQFIKMGESEYNRLYYHNKITHFTTKPELYQIDGMYEILSDVDGDYLFKRTGTVVRIVKITEHDGLYDMSCVMLEVVSDEERNRFLGAIFY